MAAVALTIRCTMPTLQPASAAIFRIPRPVARSSLMRFTTRGLSGGRPTVSALLSQLAEQHRDELTAEAGPFLQ